MTLLLRLILTTFLTLIAIQSLHAQTTQPAVPLTLAILETDVQVDLPAADRQDIAGTIDALLTSSFAKQKNLTLVDRQSLDALLKEHTNTLTGLTASQVSKDLRPFWAAGIILCPVVQQISPQFKNMPASQSRTLIVRVDAVLAQTGQCLWSIDVTGTWQNGQWQKPLTLEAATASAVDQIAQGLKQAQANRTLEIAPIKLQSPMARLLWLSDSMTDSLRASFAHPGVDLLKPRHPASTREERLLRILGLSAPRSSDAASAFASTPDYRLESLLIETPGATDLSLNKTPLSLTLKITRLDSPPAEITFQGIASEPEKLLSQTQTWLRAQLTTSNPTSVTQPQDQAASRKLANDELAIVRQLTKIAPYDPITSDTSAPILAIQSRILAHALRAAHLDPTNQEAAALIVTNVQAPYWLRGQGDSDVCFDRLVGESQRFLERFPKSKHARNVRNAVGITAYLKLYKIRRKDWMAPPRNNDVYRYGKVSAILIENDLLDKNNSNIWVDARLIGGTILSHCPDDLLEAELAYWREYWKKNIEPLKRDLPPWEYIEMYAHVRKKDHAAVRAGFCAFATRYPPSHFEIWGQDTANRPDWRPRVAQFLTLAGDPDAGSWAPPFSAPTLTWGYAEFKQFLETFNGVMPPIWTRQEAIDLPARQTLLKLTPQIREQAQKHLPPSSSPRPPLPLLIAGGSMWFCYPGQGGDINTPASLFLAPLSALNGDAVDLTPLAWPAHPTDATPSAAPPVIRTWIHTHHRGTPIVWIATNQGLARFDFLNNQWQGRWYTDRDSLPGLDIILLRPAIHQGKPKLLALSGPTSLQAQLLKAPSTHYLWVLDPDNAQVTLLTQSPAWNTYWAANNRRDLYCNLVALFKNGSKIPLSIYSPDQYPALDVQDITALQNTDDNFFLLSQPPNQPKAQNPHRLFSFSEKGFTEFDEKLAPDPHFTVTPSTDEVFYYAPGLRGQVRSPGFDTGRGKTYRPEPITLMTLASYPQTHAVLTTSNPPLIWGRVGAWGPSFNWNLLPFANSQLVAYRPALPNTDPALRTQTDAWLGPWNVPAGIDSLTLLDDRLWIVTGAGNLLCISPQEALANAPAHTTDQWRADYKRRLQESWRDHIRMHLVLKSFDQGLRLIEETRKNQPDAPADHLTLWQARFLAEKGDLPAADKLYSQLIANRDAAPFVRGIAAYSLIHVRYAAKDNPGILTAVETLTTLFPELARPHYSTQPPIIDWFVKEAAKSSKPPQ